MEFNRPDGVKLFDLIEHADPRGCLMEVYRGSNGLPTFKQFNVVQSEPGVLRGVHVHIEHADYLFVLNGTLVLGLHDIRRHSRTYGVSSVLSLNGDRPTTCYIPTGVAHGFYFPVPTTYFYGLSEEWTMDDDFGCRWDDPDLGIDWPVTRTPLLSKRDTNAPDLASIVERYNDAVAKAGIK